MLVGQNVKNFFTFLLFALLILIKFDLYSYLFINKAFVFCGGAQIFNFHSDILGIVNHYRY